MTTVPGCMRNLQVLFTRHPHALAPDRGLLLDKNSSIATVWVYTVRIENNQERNMPPVSLLPVTGQLDLALVDPAPPSPAESDNSSIMNILDDVLRATAIAQALSGSPDRHHRHSLVASVFDGQRYADSETSEPPRVPLNLIAERRRYPIKE